MPARTKTEAGDGGPPSPPSTPALWRLPDLLKSLPSVPNKPPSFPGGLEMGSVFPGWGVFSAWGWFSAGAEMIILPGLCVSKTLPNALGSKEGIRLPTTGCNVLGAVGPSIPPYTPQPPCRGHQWVQSPDLSPVRKRAL